MKREPPAMVCSLSFLDTDLNLFHILPNCPFISFAMSLLAVTLCMLSKLLCAAFLVDLLV